MKRSRPTIVDVAEAAGVSKSLVSLVLRGAPNVSSEAQEAVLEAVEALGYRPNAIARSLVERRSHVIGMMVSDLTNPFFVDLINGASNEAIGHRYRALVNTGDRNVNREAEALKTLLELQADGIIVAAPIVTKEILEKVGTETPTVVTNRAMDSDVTDSVVLDDARGAAIAVEHLVSLGHRQIVHIDGGAGPGAEQRSQGYRDSMTAHGLAEHIRIVSGSYTEDGGVGGTTALLDGPAFSAIVAPNDMAAIGALETLGRYGLSVPEDVSLVGFDDIFVASLRHIGLTSVRQDGRHMGAIALELLVQRIEAQRTDARHIVIEPTLTVRSTTAPVSRKTA